MNFRDQFTIYFIKPVGLTGPIKIGLSKHPERRLDEFRGWSPLELEMIGTVPGNWADEQFLHECLAEHHSHGEWFFPSPEVITAVEQVIAHAGVAAIKSHLVPAGNLRSKKNRMTRSKRLAEAIA